MIKIFYFIIFITITCLLGYSSSLNNNKTNTQSTAEKLVEQVRADPNINFKPVGKRNFDSNEKAKDFFFQNIDEVAKSKKSQAVPIRFPTGERGQRIEKYAHMAKQDKINELTTLLEQAKGNGAIQREILSGISRSENRKLLETVKPYLNSNIIEVKAIAIGAIGKIGNKEDFHLIEPFTKDSHPTIKMMAQMAESFLKE